MKKLKRIQVTGDEARILASAACVVENVFRRFEEANDERLVIEMEVSADFEGEPHAWWKVHPRGEHLQSGHSLALRSALDEMYGRTSADVKLQQAQRYREEAERLESEAKKLGGTLKREHPTEDGSA